MGVFSIVSKFQRAGRMVYSIEFTGANGAISAVKGKGEVTVTYAGEGLYTIAVFAGPNSTVPAKYPRLARFSAMTVGTPAAGADGGWSWTLIADNMSTAGTFQIRANSSANPPVASDVLALVARVEFVVEGQVAT